MRKPDGRLSLTFLGADGKPLAAEIRIELQLEQLKHALKGVVHRQPNGRYRLKVSKKWLSEEVDALKGVEIPGLHRQHKGRYVLKVWQRRTGKPKKWQSKSRINEFVTIPSSGELKLTFRDWKRVDGSAGEGDADDGRQPEPDPDRLQPGGNVIRQDPKPPVEITAYSAALERVPDRHGGPRVRHGVGYRNITGRPIAAVEFGLACFDHFDELIASGGGLAVESLPAAGALDPMRHPVGPSRREWLQYDAELVAFETAFAWVDQVRFADGEVWRQGRRELVNKLRGLKSSLEPGALARKPGQDD